LKPKEDQNYYKLLEVSHHAEWGEIQTAYELAKKTYKEEGIASYSLFSPGEKEAVLGKIEEAYRVLSDPKKKQKYDHALALSSPGLFVARSPSPAPPAEEILHEDLCEESIKSTREKRGISLEEISETTRINIDYLAAIEKGRFEFLPAEVYVRSYLRQVAKIIRCNDTIVEGFMKQYHASLQQKLQGEGVPIQPKSIW